MTTKIHPKERQLPTKIAKIIAENQDKRIVVVGTTCTGKSTLVSQLKKEGVDAHDMDELIFPQLTKKEADTVNKTPWTEEIGRLMDNLAKKYVKVGPGSPVFGTILFDSDLIIYLRINDEKLMERIVSRKVNFEDAKKMQNAIEREVKSSGINTIEVAV